MYRSFIKRLLDIIISLVVLTLFFWLFIIIGILVKIKLGSPVIYSTIRIGKDNKPFKLYKFRSMKDLRDENGELLSDADRLTSFCKLLRSTSLDELLEMYNILKGDMSLVGPRPLPDIYLPYYTAEELHRHDVRPGLTGLAQVNGRNSISWEEKFRYDLEYIKNISFINDFKIVLLTAKKVLVRENIGQGEQVPESLHILRRKQ